jgi:L-lactate dehydrogenase
MKKVTIIGAGSVGATIAYTIALQGQASELLMIDINNAKAEGEALDIRQGSPYFSPVKINSGEYSDAVDSDVVIITSGIPRKAGQSRLELAQTNVNVMKDIAPKITKYAPNAIYIIVSNPVDVMTYAFHKASGIPEERIIGSGTTLDTARLRSRIGEIYNVAQKNVHAYVFGEHGDSSFVTWSLANISNIPVDKYQESVSNHIDCPKLDKDEVEDYIKKSGGRIIERKGATFYAIAVSVCEILKALDKAIDTNLCVSTMMHGEYGVDNCCLSTLVSVGRNGVTGKVLLPLSPEEEVKLQKSAANLKEVIDSLEV